MSKPETLSTYRQYFETHNALKREYTAAWLFEVQLLPCYEETLSPRMNSK